MSSTNDNSPAAVLAFWFEEIDPALWWKKDSAFDAQIRRRFGALHARAAVAELYAWRRTPQGRLAEIIVLDQFSRNMFRDTAAAFACDPLALALAQEAVAAGDDQRVEGEQRSFLYMPYMHSESIDIHRVATQLFEAHGNARTVEFEASHRAIIERFGRYPHRNAILGRASTPEELEFLGQPGSSF